MNDAIERIKAYIHWKRLEKDQSDENQCMANDLAALLEAPIQIGRYKITQNKFGVWFTRDCGESMCVGENTMDEIWKAVF